MKKRKKSIAPINATVKLEPVINRSFINHFFGVHWLIVTLIRITLVSELVKE